MTYTNPELLDLNVASKEMNVARRTLQHHIESGNLPAFKIGNLWAIQRTDFEKFKAAYFRDEFDLRKQR
jgi:excisionase family DNA binding protein